MLAETNQTPVLEYLVFPLALIIMVAIARAFTKTYGKYQAESRDKKDLSGFLFDTPENPRTHVPAKEGWTTKVDRTLQLLTAGQARTEGAVKEILREVKPDGNGELNLRGIVDRAALAAGAERDRLHEEDR